MAKSVSRRLENKLRGFIEEIRALEKENQKLKQYKNNIDNEFSDVLSFFEHVPVHCKSGHSIAFNVIAEYLCRKKYLTVYNDAYGVPTRVKQQKGSDD